MNRNDDVELPADWDDDSDAGTERRRGRRAALIAFGLVALSPFSSSPVFSSASQDCSDSCSHAA